MGQMPFLQSDQWSKKAIIKNSLKHHVPFCTKKKKINEHKMATIKTKTQQMLAQIIYKQKTLVKREKNKVIQKEIYKK